MKIPISIIVVISILFLTPAVFAEGIEFVGSYDQLDNSFDLQVKGDMAYVCQHSVNPSFIILDVSNPSNVQAVGQLNHSDQTQGLHVLGSYAYLANDHNGLAIIDISDPAMPFYVGGLELGDRAYSIYVTGDIAYIADGSAGLYLINISDVSNPYVISSYSGSNSAAGIMVYEDVAYLADYFTLMKTIDISNISNPLFMDEYQGAGYSGQGIVLFDHYALLSAWGFGLHVVDITDPYNLSFVAAYPTPGECHDVWVEDYVYLANFSAGIQVLDLADPANPVQIGSYQTPGNARAIAVSDEYIYVTDGSSLQILRLTPTGMDDTEAAIPDKISLFRNYPNPFNSSTVIELRIAEATIANLSIYNIQGQKVETLIDGILEAGEYNLQWNAGGLSSGTYLARLNAGEYSETIRMQLIR